MVNLTIAVDEGTLRKAHVRALQEGTSVNALLRRYLTTYVSAESENTRAVARLRELLESYEGRSGGWTFDRDEIYDDAL